LSSGFNVPRRTILKKNSPDGAVNQENALSAFQLTVSRGALLPFGEQMTPPSRLCR
jgi:hypothetical protein